MDDFSVGAIVAIVYIPTESTYMGRKEYVYYCPKRDEIFTSLLLAEDLLFGAIHLGEL